MSNCTEWDPNNVHVHVCTSAFHLDTRKRKGASEAPAPVKKSKVDIAKQELRVSECLTARRCDNMLLSRSKERRCGK